MSIAKSHYESQAEKRKTKATLTPTGGYRLLPANVKRYEKTEAILEEMTVDVINGMPKNDCLQKLKLGLYEAQEGKPVKDLQNQQAYYNAVISRLMDDTEKAREENLAIIVSRFENLYAEALKANDRTSAINALKEMAKMLGVSQPQTQTAIQINNEKENVTINFGLLNNGD